MPISATIYACDKEQLNDENYVACAAILAMCRITPKIVEDRMAALKLGRGIVNPTNGFVIQLPPIHKEDPPVNITNWLKLVKYLDSAALIPCVY